MLIRLLLALAVLALTAGCSYNASVSNSPAFNVHSSYSDKIPGRFALYVDDRKVGYRTADVRSHLCSAHTFSVETGASFSTSVHQTFRNLVEEISVVPQPIAAEDLFASGFDGFISVALEEADFELTFIEGFWSAKVDSEAEYVARILVDGPQGRVLGTTVESSEEYRGGAGFSCDGGAAAISQASSEALKELMERLGDRLVNAPRVREITTAGSAGGQVYSNSPVAASDPDLNGTWIASSGPWHLYISVKNGIFSGLARHRANYRFEISGRILEDQLIAGSVNLDGGAFWGSLSGFFPQVSLIQNGQVQGTFQMKRRT